MAIILYNPTNEEMRTQYIGEEVIIPPAPDPKYKMRVDDARGRAVLNVLGPRGLMTLEYGDEGEGELEKAEIGRRRNDEFWRKQVMDFNQQNDDQHQRRLPYIAPTEATKAAARRLGIKLYQPMSSTDEYTEQQAGLVRELEGSKHELREKDKVIGALTDKVDRLAGMVQQMLAAAGRSLPADEGVEPNWDDLKRKIVAINSNYLQSWLVKNWTEIQSYPDEVRHLIAERWEKFYPEMPFPVTEEEARAAA